MRAGLDPGSDVSRLRLEALEVVLAEPVVNPERVVLALQKRDWKTSGIVHTAGSEGCFVEMCV